MSHDNPAADSSFPPFTPPPNAESRIPEHLLVNATPFEKHVIGELSILRQHDEWSTRIHQDTNAQVRKTNGRVTHAERDIEDAKADIVALQQDRRSVIQGWKLMVAIAVGFMGVVGFLLQVATAMAPK